MYYALLIPVGKLGLSQSTGSGIQVSNRASLASRTLGFDSSLAETIRVSTSRRLWLFLGGSGVGFRYSGHGQVTSRFQQRR